MKRCIFAASGPTTLAAKNHLAWGDLATLNRALEFFPVADIAFLGTRQKLIELAAAKALDRARRFVPLYDTALASIAELAGRAVWIPDVVQGQETERGFEGVRKAIAAGVVVGRGAAALVCLHKLGYTDIWLFGHDGGMGRLPGLGQVSKRGYDKGRFCTEMMAKKLKLRVAFYPDGPPGGSDVSTEQQKEAYLRVRPLDHRGR
jgi:hypothetical protein